MVKNIVLAGTTVAFLIFACLITKAEGMNYSDPEISYSPREKTSNYSDDGSIQPYRNNPWYWEIIGEPILLRGASDQDNLWQWTGSQLTDHLDLLVSVGGNYLRCTMSDRDEGNVFAYRKFGKAYMTLTSGMMNTGIVLYFF